jgi:hypothetical protein
VLVLDHAFVCVHPGHADAKRMRELGFTSEFQRGHAGQGTANDLVLFDENYLELLYLADRDEAERSRVRLDRRCEWKSSGASPFGIALRGPKPSTVAWTAYTLVGLSHPIWLATQTLEDPALPLIFLFDQPEQRPAGPQTWGVPGEQFAHACGAARIAGVRVEGPGYAGLDRVGLAALADVHWSEGDAHQMIVDLLGGEVDHGVADGRLHLRSLSRQSSPRRWV